MPALTFSKWSPGGNITLLFPAEQLATQTQTRLATAALEEAFLGGEQAGFFYAAEKRLRMAGGEFCVNASRAVGAFLAYQRERDTAFLPELQEEIHVSGWDTPVRLNIRGLAPQWQVEAVLQLPSCPVEAGESGVGLVRLPGISHLLIDAQIHPLPDDLHAAAAELRRCHNLDIEPATGVVWWHQCGDQLNMLPLVRVRDIDTTFVENACGSGALALALSLSASQARKNFSIMQPSGSSLNVRLFTHGETLLAGIDGPVRLVAEGTVWLPDAQTSAGWRG
ncbi:MAG: hypothetical protein J5861_08960 [Desulfovibrio sp.]|nr:hypothetical protein [Desulfovibrio sp.]